MNCNYRISLQNQLNEFKESNKVSESVESKEVIIPEDVEIKDVIKPAGLEGTIKIDMVESIIEEDKTIKKEKSIPKNDSDKKRKNQEKVKEDPCQL